MGKTVGISVTPRGPVSGARDTGDGGALFVVLTTADCTGKESLIGDLRGRTLSGEGCLSAASDVGCDGTVSAEGGCTVDVASIWADGTLLVGNEAEEADAGATDATGAVAVVSGEAAGEATGDGADVIETEGGDGCLSGGASTDLGGMSDGR